MTPAPQPPGARDAAGSSVTECVDPLPAHGPDDSVLGEAWSRWKHLSRPTRCLLQRCRRRAGVVAGKRQTLLATTYRVARRTLSDRGVAGIRLIDGQPRDLADDAVHVEPRSRWKA